MTSIHMNNFAEIAHEDLWPAARSPQGWAASVGAEEKWREQLPNKAMAREELKNLCARDNVSSETCFLSIMAWGGMRISHGRRAWAVISEISPIVDDMRSSKIGRLEAYERFRTLRAENPACGMGPAFFTKLIYFASPKHDGYIMDQWTALSANLLQEKPSFVELIAWKYRKTSYCRVSDENSVKNYEDYCNFTELLGNKFNISAEAAEIRMFSRGGKNPAAWRKYVKREVFENNALGYFSGAK